MSRSGLQTIIQNTLLWSLCQFQVFLSCLSTLVHNTNTGNKISNNYGCWNYSWWYEKSIDLWDLQEGAVPGATESDQIAVQPPDCFFLNIRCPSRLNDTQDHGVPFIDGVQFKPYGQSFFGHTPLLGHKRALVSTLLWLKFSWQGTDPAAI